VNDRSAGGSSASAAAISSQLAIDRLRPAADGRNAQALRDHAAEILRTIWESPPPIWPSRAASWPRHDDLSVSAARQAGIPGLSAFAISGRDQRGVESAH
jgi:hypothetical protein